MSTNNALVVGMGFGGLYSLYLLKQLGIDVKGIDSAADVGELLKNFPWPNNYFKQPELQAYFQEVARKHELYPLIKFNTKLASAEWDENNKNWKVKTSSTGEGKTEEFTVRYLVTAIGILHQPHIPDIPGLDKLKGKTVHSSKWTPEIAYEGKKVGVIGTGASGVQLVSALSEKAGSLTHFIRHAQYVLPAQYRPVSTEERKNINDKYDKIWEQVFNSAVGFGFDEPARPSIGFRFLFGGFNDIAANEDGNRAAVDFIHKKIKEIVKDPQKREVLTSSDWFAMRPLTDDKYYERFNQENVFAVDLKKTPISEVTANGIKTEDGTEYPLDLIIFATGFDAVNGSYLAIDFKGIDGKTLNKYWKEGPQTQLGVTTSGFPNLFFVNGPGVPFANNLPVCELSAQFAVDLIERAESIRSRGHGSGVVESTTEADAAWLDACRHLADQTLFAKTGSWFVFGENILGKKPSPRFWFGGIAEWRKAIAKSKSEGYSGFNFGLPGPESDAPSQGVRTSHSTT